MMSMQRDEEAQCCQIHNIPYMRRFTSQPVERAASLKAFDNVVGPAKKRWAFRNDPQTGDPAEDLVVGKMPTEPSGDGAVYRSMEILLMVSMLSMPQKPADTA